MAIIAALLSRLPGIPGSHPEVTFTYPPEAILLGDDEILKKTLPFGANIDEFFDSEIEDYKLLVYTFKIPNKDHRPDLASIAYAYTKGTNKFVLQDVTKELFSVMHSQGLLDIELLKEGLPIMVDGVNKNKKIDTVLGTKKFVFDVPKFLEKRRGEILGDLTSLWE